MAEPRYKGRIALLAIAILLLFSAIGARVVVVQLRPAEWIRKPMESGRTLTWNPMGSRGRIIDRNKEILAMDLAAYHICADPSFIALHGDAEAVVKVLSEVFRMPESELRAELAQTDRQYVRLRKYVPGYQLRAFRQQGIGVVYTPPGAEEGTPESVYLRGVMLEDAPLRTYPKGPLMAHVLGFSNREGVGGAGVEQRMDEYLRGKPGLRVSKVDGHRNEIYSTRTDLKAPEDGANVQLTLDQLLQFKVELAIERMRHEFNARSAWAIVQDVRTGEILAMATSPTFDPNRYGQAPPEWLRNAAIAVTYEPGSTMKAGVIAAALDRDIVAEDDLIDCENGYWMYGGKPLRDSHAMEMLTVADVIKFSSNIGTAKIALLMGDELLYAALRDFHFGDRLGVGVPGEEAGIFHAPTHWSMLSPTRIGMGHEIGVTAMQILSMMNAIANNGIQMKPIIVKRVVAPDGSVLLENSPEELGRPIGSETARLMRRLLARVTEEEGTGVRAQVEGYTVAGKTGTAQKVRPPAEGGGYYDKNFVSSFVGFIPAENPEIGIIVVADDPGEYTEGGRKIGYYGGTVCGPVFKEIAEFAVGYLRIAPDVSRVYVARPEL